MLDELCKKDSLWRKMALQICKDKDKADDIVQEMYLKFLNYNKKINDYYVFFALRDLFLDTKIKRYTKNKISFVELPNDLQNDESYNFELEEQKQKVLDNVNKLPYFERELLLVTQKISQRELSRQTDIPFRTINKTIKETKIKLWEDQKK